jgi:transposase
VGPPGRPRHTRDLQDLVAYMAQRMDKTTICRLLRVSWEAVARIVIDVVADQLDAAQLDGLFRIGIDEVSYRKGHRYLTVVADHDRDGAVVWAKEGRDAKTLEAFYDELGDQRCAQLEAVSLDMGGAYKKATDARAGQARQCVDPFHLVKLANEAVDKTRRWAWNLHRGFGLGSSRWVKRTRWALLKDPDHLKCSTSFAATARCSIAAGNSKKEFGTCTGSPTRPPPNISTGGWAWACPSRIPAFVALSRTVRANRDRILAAVERGLSNSKLEGLNSKIRLINHRGYGHHSAAAIIAMVYLCCGGITVELPFK